MKPTPHPPCTQLPATTISFCIYALIYSEYFLPGQRGSKHTQEEEAGQAPRHRQAIHRKLGVPALEATELGIAQSASRLKMSVAWKPAA